jgi:hypothetical protein
MARAVDGAINNASPDTRFSLALIGRHELFFHQAVRCQVHAAQVDAKLLFEEK